MLKKTVTLFTVITFSVLHAQNEIDALRFSLFNNYNTAGISALGGAGGLLSPGQNPASLAFFSGDRLLSVSLGNSDTSIETTYLDTKNIYEPFDINPFIQNIGYVQSLPFATNNEWNRINMSLSFNRKYDFNKNMIMSGYNNASSMTNMFLNSAQGLTVDELRWFDDYLAWYTYLIDTIPNWTGFGPNTSYQSSVYSEGNNQIQEIYEDGYINEVDIAFSGAYKDFLFLGASIGITEIKFIQTIKYAEYGFEEIDDIPSPQLESFRYNQTLETYGEGVNFKFGTFIKPTSFLRLGWAYHSKTYTQLSEGFRADMTTNFFNFDEQYIQVEGIPEEPYRLSTPAKSIASVGLISSYKKLRMLMTFDYEMIDYGSSDFSPNFNHTFSQENQNISDIYAKTNNTKLGISCSMDNISIRGGYSVFGGPFKNDLYENNGEKEYISAGLGFKKGQYSFDIAMIHCTQNEDHILYQDPTLESPDQIANINYASNTVILTCNYKF